ncbi:heterokaryon incompatibility protein-domain-containing protein [Aspergillus caelatus]|uniref:Heterokaryon incompatibility protein-domain-containing protein n=1 Tax=Aspergillus caelatus TaxID=61420 RepID=A0A5N6ZWS0_9EURO|nr:heterokaryon incompatibility protein-domain-containing protein [Aspergillus caelatus]KAE8361379.1 heterokaryon incompatibility protein-domain-containing protein [Aspergillus caelatus]
MTKKGDPAEKFGVPAITSPLPGTRSDDSFKFIEHCLQECLGNHNCSISMFRSRRHATFRTTTVNDGLEPKRPNDMVETGGPLRLVDVRAFCGDHNYDIECGHNVRLVENLPVCPRYMTLSHCWGQKLDTNAITTRGNLSSRMKGIKLDDLPANFRDAISITRRLGIQYLWIDALCIIQDSQADWAQESMKMGYIYDGSYLTVAASASEDSTGGCYRSTGIRQDKLGGGSLIEIINRLTVASGQPSTLIFWAPNLSEDDPLREPAPLIGCALSQRGWVFQERILSPRTIHFTNSQLVWECRELYEMEDRLPFVTAQGTLSLAMNREISPDRIRQIWYDWLIGFGYSSRKFTMMEDRLIAIAGIARSLHERTGVPYIAGLWTNNLGFGLGWLEKPKHRTQYHSQPSNKFNSRRRPTWTWASTDQEFQYSLRDFEEDRDFHYVDNTMKTLGDVNDPFTIIIGGWLKIRGRVYEGPTSYFTRLCLDTMAQQEVLGAALAHSEVGSSAFNPPSWVYIQLGQFRNRTNSGDIIIEESWLIVRRVEASEEEYERIGIAYRNQELGPLTRAWQDWLGEDFTKKYLVRDLKLV